MHVYKHTVCLKPPFFQSSLPNPKIEVTDGGSTTVEISRQVKVIASKSSDSEHWGNFFYSSHCCGYNSVRVFISLEFQYFFMFNRFPALFQRYLIVTAFNRLFLHNRCFHLDLELFVIEVISIYSWWAYSKLWFS